jgi:hypothetical protein
MEMTASMVGLDGSATARVALQHDPLRAARGSGTGTADSSASV